MKAKITISRGSEDQVRVRLRDEASRVVFAEASLSMEAFAFAITGCGEQEVELSVMGLEFVGKNLITEERTIACPLTTYDKGELELWLKENAQEDGWILNAHLRSQRSITRHEGVTMLRYSVKKYVSDDEA